MKNILFICLTLLLNACVVAPPYAHHNSYGYGVNVSRPYYPNSYYQQPYYSNHNYYNNPSRHEHHEYNERGNWGGGNGYRNNGEHGGRYR